MWENWGVWWFGETLMHLTMELDRPKATGKHRTMVSFEGPGPKFHCWYLLHFEKMSYVHHIEGCMLQKNEQYTPMIWYMGRSCQSDLPWFRPRLYPVPPVEAQVQTRAVRCLVVGWGSAGMLTTEHIVIWLCPKRVLHGFTMFYPQMASHSNFDIINDGDHLFRFVPMKRQTHTNPYLCMLYFQL